MASVDLCWPLLVSFGPFWPLLASVGLCWPLLASVGLCWSLLASVDLFWPLLITVCICWPLFAYVGLCWPLLASVGLCWPLLASDGLGGQWGILLRNIFRIFLPSVYWSGLTFLGHNWKLASIWEHSEKRNDTKSKPILALSTSKKTVNYRSKNTVFSIQ